jgi:hypothetical protein
MKEYKAKYDIDSEVYVLTSKKIIQASVKNIKIIDTGQYKELTILNNQQVLTDKDGVTIEYLIETHKEQPVGCKGFNIFYDWFKEEDVFDNKEELIKQIK